MDWRDIDLGLSFTSASIPLTAQKFHCIRQTNTHAHTNTHARAITAATVYVVDTCSLCWGYVILGTFAKPDLRHAYPFVHPSLLKEQRKSNQTDFREIPYILESNPHPNLIRTSFCRFLKRKKKKVSSRF